MPRSFRSVTFGVRGASAVFAEQRSGWPETLRIGTASIGGTHVVQGDGLALLINEKPGITTTPQGTGGPYHNLALVQGGHVELGMTTMYRERGFTVSE
jgi:uncharacterized protein